MKFPLFMETGIISVPALNTVRVSVHVGGTELVRLMRVMTTVRPDILLQLKELGLQKTCIA